MNTSLRLLSITTGLLLATPALAVLPGSQKSFPDVTAEHPHYEAIQYMIQQNIVQGYPDGTFKPDNRVNRAEFVRMVAVPQILSDPRIQDCIVENFSQTTQYIFFPDVTRDQWFAPYVCIAKTKKLIDGYPDGTFKPADYISFVEAAKILTGIFYGNPDTTDPWYKAYVTVLEGRKAIPMTVNAFDQKVTRGQLAEMLYRLKTQKTDKPSLTYDQLAK